MAAYQPAQQANPVEVYRRGDGDNGDKPIPPETLAILNTRPACMYDRPKYNNRCKKGVSTSPAFKTDYDYASPYITYRKFRSNRYRKNKGHMVVSGDRYVHQNLTRSYIFHRPPFDWYDATKADILDDIEEVVPIAGTLDKVHSKDIYSTPNFIANQHVLNMHNNRLNLSDDSDESEEEYEEYVGYHNGEPRLMRHHSSEPRPRSRMASRPIHPEDDESDYEVPKSRSLNQFKEASRRPLPPQKYDDDDFKNRKNKSGNRAPPPRRFYKRSEEAHDDYEERRPHVTVNSYSDFKSVNGNLKKSEEYGEYVHYKEEVSKNARAKSLSNMASRPKNPPDDYAKDEERYSSPANAAKSKYEEYEEKRSSNLKTNEVPKIVTISRSPIKPKVKSLQEQDNNESLASTTTVKAIPYPYSIYSESTAKIFNQKEQPIKEHEGYLSNVKRESNNASATTRKNFQNENRQGPIDYNNKSNFDNAVVTQIIKDVIRVHASEKSNKDSGVKYY